MKYKADIILPIAWEELIEADSLEEAKKIAEQLIENDGWVKGLKILVNDEATNLVDESMIEIDEVYKEK